TLYHSVTHKCDSAKLDRDGDGHHKRSVPTQLGMESIDEQLQAFGSMMKGRSAVKRAKKERRILRAM
ncbi:hypothetical protein PF001_g30872, partial [Phytophthora fragariae]